METFLTPAHQGQVKQLWARLGDVATHNAAILEIARAPLAVREILDARSAEVARAFYATPAGEAELSDWRPLDGEPFLDDEVPLETRGREEA